MKRASTMAVVGFACLTLAACQSTVSGSAVPNSGAISTPVAAASGSGVAVASSSPEISTMASAVVPESAAPASSGNPAAGASTGGVAAGTSTSSQATATGKASNDSGDSGASGASGASGGSGGGGGSGSDDNDPAILSLKITCSYDANQLEYVASAHYRVANATGIAVSVDDPGAVGSFGSAKGAEGDIDLPSNGCYADSGEQVYDFDTTGGSPAAHKEIKRTGTHQRGDKPAPPAPKITDASLVCSKQDDGSYGLTLQWAVANATGLALSVDNPGGVGSFGTYDGTSGHVDLPSNACYSDAGSHEFDLQTVGGADPQATRVLNFNGGHSRPGSGDTTSTATTAATTTTTPPPGG